MVVLNFIILVIRICFGQFYKIRRDSNFEFYFFRVESASVPILTGGRRGPPYFDL